MAKYLYKAFAPGGSTVTGQIDAATQDEVTRLLRGRNLIAFDIFDTATGDAKPWWQKEIHFRRGLSRAVLTSFTRELSVLLNAHLTVEEALVLIARRNNAACDLASSLLEGVRSGRTLSELFEDRPRDAPPFYAAMLKAGEAGGQLGPVLEELARLLERMQHIKSRLRAALVYPIILFAMAGVTLGVVISVLVPGLLPLFDGREEQLPSLIRILIGARWLVETQWLLLLVSLAALCGGSYLLLRMETVRYAIDRLILTAPVAGSLARDIQAARFAGTMGSLLRGGVPLPRALHVSRSVVANRVLSESLERVLISIREGGTFSQLISQTPLPDRLSQLAAVGERAGRLDDMLNHTARILEDEVQLRIERLMSLVSPLITLAIGLAIGGLVMSVMDAILSVNDIAIR
jgi:general secretion pathway protein F